MNYADSFLFDKNIEQIYAKVTFHGIISARFLPGFQSKSCISDGYLKILRILFPPSDMLFAKHFFFFLKYRFSEIVHAEIGYNQFSEYNFFQTYDAEVLKCRWGKGGVRGRKKWIYNLGWNCSKVFLNKIFLFLIHTKFDFLSRFWCINDYSSKIDSLL